MVKKRSMIAVLIVLIILFTNLGGVAFALQDTIVSDDLEGFAVGAKPTYPAGAWGGNTTIPISVVQEENGNKAVQYTGYGAYGVFQVPQEVEGRLLVETSIKLPAVFTSFMLSVGNVSNYALVYMGLYSDGRVVITQRASDGKETNVVLPNKVPIDKWFNLKISVDTYNQAVKIFIDNIQNGVQYDFRYKLSAVDEPANPSSPNNVLSKKTKLKDFRFANRTSTDTDKIFLLDNFKISYERAILPVDDIHTIIDVGTSYIFPSALPLKIDDGTTRDIPVRWEASGNELDSNTLGIYTYKGYITDYAMPITLTIDVRQRVIEHIPDVSESILTTDLYNLPSTVTAVMNDGSPKIVSVVWEISTVDASISGYREIIGSVEGYSGIVKYKLTVIPREVKSVDLVTVGVQLGESFTPPYKVKAVLIDGQIRNVGATWTSGSVDINTVGRYYYEGKADGYQQTIYMVVTVFKENMEDENRMLAVKEFYDNALANGRDRSRYGANLPEILFADAIDVRNGEFAKWPFPDGRDTPFSSLASQQVLMRGLVGMTALTGDSKYKQAAVDNFRYYFDHFQSPNGLIRWGGHQLVNMATYQIESDEKYATVGVHELKDHYPYYELMFEVDPEKTQKYIKGLWLGHIEDWNTLEFSRHAKFETVKTQNDFDNVWNYNSDPVRDTPLFFSTKYGALTFLNAADDYIYAAGFLVKYKNDTGALKWMKNLENMYLRGRDPKTGLMGFIFTSDSVGGTLPEDVYDPLYTVNIFGDRVQRIFPEVNLTPYDIALKSNPNAAEARSMLAQDYYTSQYAFNPAILLKMADLSGGEDAKIFEQNARELVDSFGDYLYDPIYNAVKPSLIDGTNLTGYIPKRDGYFSAYGGVMKLMPMISDFSISFARTYVRTGSEKIWKLLRNEIDANTLGDIGTAPGVNVELDTNTTNADPYILISLLELYNKFHNQEYLEAARTIGNNIVNKKFMYGYFVQTNKSRYAVLNAVEPYALIMLEAAIRGVPNGVPEFMGKGGYLNLDYREDDGSKTVIWATKIYNATIGAPSSITNLSFEQHSIELKIGDKLKIDFVVEPSDAEDKTLTWESSDTEVATVNEDGEITALKAGKVRITGYANAGPFFDTADMNVLPQ